LVIVLFVAIATATSRAATVTWTGGAGGTNWSATGNWSASPPGSSDDVVFTDVAGAAAHGTLTSTIDADTTLKSLSYQLGATPVGFFHTTQIAAGKTLLLTGGLSVAPISVGTSADPPATLGKQYPIDVTILGPNATLQVGSSATYTANLVVGRSAGTGTGSAYSSHSSGKLDLSGLDNFVANLNTLVLAHGIEWSNKGMAEVTLATNNTIAAKSIETGSGIGNAKIYLGQNNTIRADSFSLNLGKGNSIPPLFATEMRFRNGLANPVLNLTGLNNAGVDLAIANNSTSPTGATTDNVVDLSGGTFNATIDELTIGRFIYANAGGAQGTLIMTAGTATANTLTMAVSSSSSPLNTKGTLTLRGGSFTVNGDVTSGSGVAALSIDGGSFTADNILLASGSTVGQATINLAGGTLSAASIGKGEGSLAFNFTGGTLHVGSFGTSANRMNLVQTGGTLSPGNSAGLTTIEGNYQLTSGTLALELDGLAGAGLAGGHDQLVVNGDVALAGDLDLTLGFAPTLGTSLVLLDNRGANAITGTFDGLAEQSDVDLLFDDETYTFSITYQGGDGNDVVLRMGIVPEPTAAVLLLVGASLLLGLRRRCVPHSGISSRAGSSAT
jgi:hypothetical protein